MTSHIVALSNAVCVATGLTPQDVSVSVGSIVDRATWRVTFHVTPTPAQETAASNVLASFNPATVDAANAQEEARRSTFRADGGRIDLLNRLRAATPSQIDTWLQNNVTNLSQARAVLAAIIKVIALDGRD